jgi:hypothetical protein
VADNLAVSMRNLLTLRNDEARMLYSQLLRFVAPESNAPPVDKRAIAEALGFNRRMPRYVEAQNWVEDLGEEFLGSERILSHTLFSSLSGSSTVRIHGTSARLLFLRQ